MANITEQSLFQLCVSSPKHAALDILNLENITMTQDESTEKKAMKLYHMVWSGITKFLRLVV